ncbi:MAG: tetratricopeptide repeat protein [Planctomycetota bacterium]|jgi:tetratricopeptide (TPR) repeat protein
MAIAVDTTRLSQRASEALERGNYDYAIELLLDVLRANPDDLKARISLRQATRMKEEKGRAGGAAGALAGFPKLLAAWLLSLFGKRDSAILQYEKCLTRNPSSPFVTGMLATALQKTGREDAAVVVLESLRQVRPNHIRTLRRLARTYVEREDIQRAMQRYQGILQYRPNDIEAGKQVHDLAATESIHEGWEKGEEGFQEKIRDRELAARLEQAQHIVRTADQATDAVTRVKADIEKSPESPVLWAELGDLERRRDNYPDAVEAYNKAIELDPRNQLYVQKLMDTRLLDFDRRVREATAAASASPGDASLKERAKEIENEKERFWLGELTRRTEERPTDSGLRFELGNLLFKMDRINESTAAFQRVVRDPKFRVAATAMLGKCFARKNLDELAIEQFERALEGSNLMEENGKDIAYNLGVLYEKVGNLVAAEDAYKKIFEIDIGFRDIAQKMESIYKARRDKKGPSNPQET